MPICLSAPALIDLPTVLHLQLHPRPERRIERQLVKHDLPIPPVTISTPKKNEIDNPINTTHFIAPASKGCAAADQQPPRTWGRRTCSRPVRALSGTEASASPASSTGIRTSGSAVESTML